jgi:hypothetical protein
LVTPALRATCAIERKAGSVVFWKPREESGQEGMYDQLPQVLLVDEAWELAT